MYGMAQNDIVRTQEQLEVVNPRARIQLTADFAGPAAGSSSL